MGLHRVVSLLPQDTNPMQAIAVSQTFAFVRKSRICVFSFCQILFFGCRTLKTRRCPSRSSDSSVSCVWSSCWTAQRESVTCCGPSSSLSRSAALASSAGSCCTIIFSGPRVWDCAGVLSSGSPSCSSAHCDALLYLRRYWDAGTSWFNSNKNNRNHCQHFCVYGSPSFRYLERWP